MTEAMTMNNTHIPYFNPYPNDHHIYPYDFFIYRIALQISLNPFLY